MPKFETIEIDLSKCLVKEPEDHYVYNIDGKVRMRSQEKEGLDSRKLIRDNALKNLPDYLIDMMDEKRKTNLHIFLRMANQINVNTYDTEEGEYIHIKALRLSYLKISAKDIKKHKEVWLYNFSKQMGCFDY